MSKTSSTGVITRTASQPKREVIMKRQTALWLVENTTLSFEQIAKFCNLSPIEVRAIADGVLGNNFTPANPIVDGYLTTEEIKRCEADSTQDIQITSGALSNFNIKFKTFNYTPYVQRKNKISGIVWLINSKNDITDSEIAKLLSVTKETVKKVRDKTHRMLADVVAKSPVVLGLCTAAALNNLMQKYNTDQTN